jgi:fatty acid desaturase
MMHLSARSDARGLMQLAIHAALLLGVVQVALFAPLHETVHHTAFANRKLNAVVGWLAGAPSLFNWHFYQQFHLAHHRHTQDPAKDPELAPPPPTRLPGYVVKMLALTYWRGRARNLWDGLRGDLSAYPFIHPAGAPRVITSMRAMVAMLAGGSIAAGLEFGWQAPLLFWVLPQLVGQLLRLYLFTEHTGCSMDRNGLTNTRTVLTTRPLRLLMWNMPFHAEHHLYPFIPFHRLGEAHALLRDRLAHVHPGYVRWHAGHLKGMRT